MCTFDPIWRDALGACTYTHNTQCRKCEWNAAVLKASSSSSSLEDPLCVSLPWRLWRSHHHRVWWVKRARPLLHSLLLLLLRTGLCALCDKRETQNCANYVPETRILQWQKQVNQIFPLLFTATVDTHYTVTYFESSEQLYTPLRYVGFKLQSNGALWQILIFDFELWATKRLVAITLSFL